MLLGGHTDGHERIFGRFLDLAGKGALVCLVTAAAEDPAATAERYTTMFTEEFGVEIDNIFWIPVSRDDPDAAQDMDTVETVSGLEN